MSATPGVPQHRYGPRRDTAWMEHAACIGLPSEFFFPDRGERINPAVKQMCADCPVQIECLQHAVENHECLGIWGGVGERDRRRIGRGIQKKKPA